MQQLGDWFTQMNHLAPGMRITKDASGFSAVFLDCRFFKGRRWLSTGILDVQLYSKPQNRFLYKPFCSTAPVCQFLGVISSELKRYIKRNSNVSDYLSDAAAFYDRLRVRGYPPWFLRRAFDKAPSWLSRNELLSTRRETQTDKRIHAFKLMYSTELSRLGVGTPLHRAEHLLPDYIVGTKVVCWRAAPRLGRALIPYRYSATPAASTEASAAALSANLSSMAND